MGADTTPSDRRASRAVLAPLLVMLALTAASCNGSNGSNGSNGDPELAAPTPEAEREAVQTQTFTAEDLERIVLAPADAPDGTEHVQSFDGAEAAVLPIEHQESPEAEAAVQAGLVAARASMFAGPEMLPVVGSLGVVYESPDAAVAALEAFRTAMRADPGFGDPEAYGPGLGEEGAVFRGVPADAPEGFQEEEIHYVWRIGNLLGWVLGVDYDEDSVRGIAEEMTSRATG